MREIKRCKLSFIKMNESGRGKVQQGNIVSYTVITLYSDR